MRVFLVHNFYGSEAPSGENQVFQAEKTLLEQSGHSVVVFFRHSDEIRGQGLIGAIKGAAAVPWNPFAATALRRQVKDFQPDVVHVHNNFPLISPAIFHAIGKQAARVLTLHNYRLFCPAAIPMRHGQVCTNCLDSQSSLPSLRYGCYRNSRVATLPLAFSVALHRLLGTWTSQVEAFIALTAFQRDVMVKAGLPQDKVHVKPNFYPGRPKVVPWEQREPYVIFAGRLSAEKGGHRLIEAWKAWGHKAPELRLAGDGPLRQDWERIASGLPVRFLGQLSMQQAQEQIACARLLILPSECFEGFPMVVREAFAFGTPAAVSNIGPLPSIVRHGESGLVFQPFDSLSLLQTVRSAWQTPGLLQQLGQGARAEFENKYTQETNYALLMEIYGKAMAVSRTPPSDTP